MRVRIDRWCRRYHRRAWTQRRIAIHRCSPHL